MTSNLVHKQFIFLYTKPMPGSLFLWQQFALEIITLPFLNNTCNILPHRSLIMCMWLIMGTSRVCVLLHMVLMVRCLCAAEVIWVIAQVDESGLLGVTQQLSQCGSDFSQHPHHNPSQNPFASPVKPASEGGTPLFSSPSPSLITHAGSLPTTPGSVGGVGSGIMPSCHPRAALFQVS